MTLEVCTFAWSSSRIWGEAIFSYSVYAGTKVSAVRAISLKLILKSHVVAALIIVISNFATCAHSDQVIRLIVQTFMIVTIIF
jgi:hypothetical protein